MITQEEVDNKRAYIDTLEPSMARSACYQLLEDLEKTVRERDEALAEVIENLPSPEAQ